MQDIPGFRELWPASAFSIYFFCLHWCQLSIHLLQKLTRKRQFYQGCIHNSICCKNIHHTFNNGDIDEIKYKCRGVMSFSKNQITLLRNGGMIWCSLISGKNKPCQKESSENYCHLARNEDSHTQQTSTKQVKWNMLVHHFTLQLNCSSNLMHFMKWNAYWMQSFCRLSLAISQGGE